MKHYKSTVIRFGSIQCDDWFKLGGAFYRVISTQNNWNDNKNDFAIGFINPNESVKQPDLYYTMVMDINTPFKIYNQK